MKLFNTINKTLEEFIPSDKENVKIYSCGPTVYNYAHIGNFRTFLFNDLLRRYLKFRGYRVNHVVNLTDIDDKTIKGAALANMSLRDFTAKYIEIFFHDLATLNIEPVEHNPRATDYMAQMIEYIQGLAQSGHTYNMDGSTYFKISSFDKYGRLSGTNLIQNQTGTRYDTDEYDKEDVRDFVLWKGAKENEPAWPTPFGPGRPGWHIECSAMAQSILGETLDIHTGGVDLIFPHHENEIAQSECFNHGQQFVRYWLHCEHLLVDNTKMSKSLGNLYTLQDLIDRGYSGREIRYFLLSAHYRKKLNFTFSGLEGARASLKRIDNTTRRLAENLVLDKAFFSQEDAETFIQRFQVEMDEDLNISAALASLYDYIHLINRDLDSAERGNKPNQQLTGHDILQNLRHIDQVLGYLFPENFPERAKSSDLQRHTQADAVLEDKPSVLGAAEIEKLIEERLACRKEKKFARADEIRKSLVQAGIVLEDTAQGTRWFRSED